LQGCRRAKPACRAWWLRRPEGRGSHRSMPPSQDGAGVGSCREIPKTPAPALQAGRRRPSTPTAAGNAAGSSAPTSQLPSDHDMLPA
jgi:hypothetical protein